jgi:hypothetical protein
MQNAALLAIKAGGSYSYRSSLKGLTGRRTIKKIQGIQSKE